MGVLKKLLLGRWFGRWLLRGGPWAVALKLAGVALYGIWRSRRRVRLSEQERRRLEVDADYEVVPEGRLEPGDSVRNPDAAPGYSPGSNPQRQREEPRIDPREEKS